jgi:hypothetical protein
MGGVRRSYNKPFVGGVTEKIWTVRGKICMYVTCIYTYSIQ